MPDISIPLDGLRACWLDVDTAARAVADTRWPTMPFGAMPGSAVAALVASDPWSGPRDAVVADMLSWSAAARAAVARCEAADAHGADGLPVP